MIKIKSNKKISYYIINKFVNGFFHDQMTGNKM